MCRHLPNQSNDSARIAIPILPEEHRKTYPARQRIHGGVNEELDPVIRPHSPFPLE
jgi:hypothetical protein